MWLPVGIAAAAAVAICRCCSVRIVWTISTIKRAYFRFYAISCVDKYTSLLASDCVDDAVNQTVWSAFQMDRTWKWSSSWNEVNANYLGMSSTREIISWAVEKPVYFRFLYLHPYGSEPQWMNCFAKGVLFRRKFRITFNCDYVSIKQHWFFILSLINRNHDPNRVIANHVHLCMGLKNATDF